MSTNTYQETAQETAKIYQFPIPSLRLIADRRRAAQAIAASMPQGVCDELDNCWYHGAAVNQTPASTNS